MQAELTEADLTNAINSEGKNRVYNCPVAQCLKRVTGRKIGVSHSVASTCDETYFHNAADIVNLYDAWAATGFQGYLDILRERLPMVLTFTPRDEVPQLCEVVQLAIIDHTSPQSVEA